MRTERPDLEVNDRMHEETSAVSTPNVVTIP